MTSDALDNMFKSFEELADRRVRAAFKAAAEIVRKKIKSHEAWGWDPSADEEQRAQMAMEDAAKEATRNTLSEIADALDEAGEEKR